MKYIISLFLLICMTACSEQQAQVDNPSKYEKEGISFEYPANWEVVEDSEIESYRYVFVQSTGSAIVRIQMFQKDDFYDLNEFVETDIEAKAKEMPSLFGINSNNGIKKHKTMINGVEFDGYQYEFNVSVLKTDDPHISEYYSYTSSNEVAYLSLQVATEDYDKVSSGFEQILGSFKME